MANVNKYVLTEGEDKDRIDFLFSPLPKDKSVNPKNWTSKISYWKNEIRKFCRERMDMLISLEKLKEAFQNDEKRSPSCLNEVLRELYQSSDIIFFDDISNVFQNTWSKWALNTASKTASWVWRSYWSGSFHLQTVFVLQELLEEYALLILEYHYKNVKYEKTDNVVPWNVLKNLYKVNGKNLRDEDLLCIVGYLYNIGKCTVHVTPDNEKIVKFKSKNQQKIDPISQNDLEILKIKQTIARLSIESKQIENEIKRFQEKAQICLKNKDKTQAKKILIQKQRLQKTLTLKQDAVYSMKEHLRTVQEADTTKLITDAFNSSSTLLQNTYREKGLTVDRVDDIFDKTREANDMVNEVNEAISTGMTVIEDDNYDMDELEQELEKLNEEDLTEIADKIPSLPNVPDHSPAKEKTSIKMKREERKIISNPIPA